MSMRLPGEYDYVEAAELHQVRGPSDQPPQQYMRLELDFGFGENCERSTHQQAAVSAAVGTGIGATSTSYSLLEADHVLYHHHEQPGGAYASLEAVRAICRPKASSAVDASSV